MVKGILELITSKITLAKTIQLDPLEITHCGILSQTDQFLSQSTMDCFVFGIVVNLHFEIV